MSEEGKTINSFSAWSSERGPLPPRIADEDYGDYFHRLMTKWSFRAKEAEQVHEKWKRRLDASGGVRESDCKRRIFIVLQELMDSAFLKNDYIDTGMPKEDCRRALQELKEHGFQELCQKDGADWKFALLTRHLRKQGESRVMVDEHMAGFYIDEVREQIPEEAAEAFFRFATFTRLAYQELNRLKAAKPQEQKKEDEPTPEQKAVNDFVDKIICLANAVYDKYNDKIIVPAVNQPEVKITVLKDDLISMIKMKKEHHFEQLKELCYPVNSKSNGKFCRYVRWLQDKKYFGQLPNNLLAKVLAPIIGLEEGSVKNYLSKKDSL